MKKFMDAAPCCFDISDASGAPNDTMRGRSSLQGDTTQDEVPQFRFDDPLLGLRQVVPQSSLSDLLEGLVERAALLKALQQLDASGLDLYIRMTPRAEYLALADVQTEHKGRFFLLSSLLSLFVTASNSKSRSRRISDLLVCLPQAFTVLDCLQMTDCSPRSAKAVDYALEGIDEPIPGGRNSRLELVDRLPALCKKALDPRRDVLCVYFIEVWERGLLHSEAHFERWNISTSY